MTSRLHRPSARRHGYTLIEIMTALAILMIGATGIFAIQTGATVANMEARRMATAAQVSQTVLERIRRDALLWRSGGATMDATALVGTAYLSAAPPNGDPVTAWMNAPVVRNADPREGFAFDYYGRDVDPGDVDAIAYCAQYRLDWVTYGETLRADVRVYFPRRSDPGDVADPSAYLGCPDGITDLSSSYRADLSFAHTTTNVRWTPVGP